MSRRVVVSWLARELNDVGVGRPSSVVVVTNVLRVGRVLPAVDASPAMFLPFVDWSLIAVRLRGVRHHRDFRV